MNFHSFSLAAVSAFELYDALGIAFGVYRGYLGPFFDLIGFFSPPDSN